MYCKLCQKFDCRNRQNQSKVWNKEACTTIRKDVMTRHEASVMHKEALEQERECQLKLLFLVMNKGAWLLALLKNPRENFAI